MRSLRVDCSVSVQKNPLHRGGQSNRHLRQRHDDACASIFTFTTFFNFFIDAISFDPHRFLKSPLLTHHPHDCLPRDNRIGQPLRGEFPLLGL